MLTMSEKGKKMPESPIRKLVPFSEKAKKKGINVLHLNIGQPDILPPKNVIQKINNFKIDEITYSHSAGIEDYRKKLAIYYQKIQKHISYQDILITTGGSEALNTVLNCICDPGDEIITSDFTFASTAEVVLLMGLKLKLVDINEETFNIDPLSVERAITSKTKAIIPVHLFGQTAEMEKIVEIAKLNNLKIIEDNAQALGATYTFNNGSSKKTGTIGDIGTTSFFPSKNLGAYGDGGAIYTDDDILAQKMRKLANHGMDKRK